jgi:hypothetical protein
MQLGFILTRSKYWVRIDWDLCIGGYFTRHTLGSDRKSYNPYKPWTTWGQSCLETRRRRRKQSWP